jgi:acyl-CoA synthetase (NDP forming)
VVTSVDEALRAAEGLGYPVVIESGRSGTQSDVGGCVLHVRDAETVRREFERMIRIPETTAVLLQPMLRVWSCSPARKRRMPSDIWCCADSAAFLSKC